MPYLRPLIFPTLAAAALLFAGCETTNPNTVSRQTMTAEIKAEPPGNYFIGRRYYKVDYKFWGWVRKPGEPWGNAVMVMLNENQKFAPDRELGKIGSDNNYEYKLFGEFSGQRVYEPASNGFYPEFVLKGTELRSASPGNIYKAAGATDPTRRIIPHPY
ncbi:MAG: hypothetical protein K8R23_04770 [Chthoniobacter sp.]|nr:hypothetical protein [Chthoniobacter sp.]